jgi:hypothetical protein
MEKGKECSLKMNAFSENRKEILSDSGFGITVDVSLDSNCGLFRRYHVENKPINLTDPLGFQAEALAAGWGIALGEPTPFGEIIMTGVTIGVIGSTIWDAINDTPDKCDDKKEYCSLLYENDLSICRKLGKADVRSRCYQSAMERKIACETDKPLPPLVTW